MADRRVDVAIVGAGFCGLALGAALRRYRVPDVQIFERGPGVGHFWTGNYDRIHLHSPWHGLPDDGALGARYPMYKSRDQLVEYLGAYAAHHQLGPWLRLNCAVERVERAGDTSWPWALQAADGTTTLARVAAVCTSLLRVPWVPEIPGRDGFGGTCLHSRGYRDGAAFSGQRAVVVGSGNSACEIATDLVEAGAAVSLLVYGPRHFMRLSTIERMMKIFKPLGLAGDAQIRRLHRATWGTKTFDRQVDWMDRSTGLFLYDMRPHGIPRPAAGLNREGLINGRVGVFDVGAIDHIRAGRIRVIRDRIAAFTPDGLALRDSGEQIPADVVVMATGFRHGLGAFLAEASALLGPFAGYVEDLPRTDMRCRSAVHPDLFFPGFDRGLLGGLHWGLWGWEVGEKIALDLGTFREADRPAEFGGRFFHV